MEILIGRDMMHHLSTTMTQRGQVTLPAEVRRILGVKPKEKVTFEVDGEDIRLVRAHFTVASVRGSVPALQPSKTLEEITAIAGDEHVHHVLAETTPSV